ncbi:MAG: sulfurtransferase [Halanaerobacter sp.]
MNLKLRKRVIVMVMMVCAFAILGAVSVQAADDYTPISERGYAHTDSLMSCKELNKIKDQDNVKIVDNGHKAKFMAGHIPGAVNIEKGEMKADAGMRISKEEFEDLLSEYGISNEDTIVVYDRHGNKYASWFWWLAKLYGHEDVKLLDGGLTRWDDLDFDKKRWGSKADKTPTDYTAEEIDKSWLATLDEVRNNLENEDVVIMDTRAQEEYKGEKLLSGAGRKGRIPNSVWLEWHEDLNEDNTFQTAAEIKDMYEKEGITADERVITYCQSAVRSSHALFTMTELLGYENVKNYDGSWIEWSNNEDLPIE